MQKFVYEYATKVYFGEGAGKEHLAEAISGYGQNVMLAYGGSTVRDPGPGIHGVSSEDAGDLGSL